MLPFPSSSTGIDNTVPSCPPSSLPQFTKVSLGVVGRRMLRTMLAKVMKNDSHVRKECKKIARIREATVPELVQMASIAGLNNFVHSAKAFSSTLKQSGVWSPTRDSSTPTSTANGGCGGIGVMPSLSSTGYLSCSNFSSNIQSSSDTFSTDYGSVAAYSSGDYDIRGPTYHPLLGGNEQPPFLQVPSCTLTDLCLLDITSKASSCNGMSEQDIIGLRTLTCGQHYNSTTASAAAAAGAVPGCSNGAVELSAPIYPRADNEELRLLSYCARAFVGPAVEFF